jgi:hypothetical protein
LPSAAPANRADSLLKQVPARAWQQVSCGKGAKGHRRYDWAFLRLDHHAMLAYAFLAVAAATERTRRPCPSGLIGLTCNEIQHLLAALAPAPAGGLEYRLHWSVWRRRQQARARACHYQRQAAQEP